MGFFQRFTRPKAKLWLAIEKNEVALGEEIKGIIGIKSEEEFDIKEITAWLRCWESIKKTRGYYETIKKRSYETGEMTEEKEWVEEEYWDEEKLHSEYLQICKEMHINVGFNNEFPFVFKIPASGRETYRSVDKKVEWLIDATMNIKGRRHIETQKYILVAKPSVVVKEVVREVVLIPCAYCGGLVPQTATFCPNCGAKRKGF